MEFESDIRKNLWIFFQKYGFIRKIESFHLRMKHIIQMTSTVGLTLAHSINPNFSVHFRLFGLQSRERQLRFRLNRLWMVSVTIILNDFLQKIVQRGEIKAPTRPIDIRISADYSIFENGARPSNREFVMNNL